ncbi:IclR family transcriptional regulator [Microvirga thermotolerans]|uniref:Helix-turn-helix domain-containing protein n=1 Tax=Microvirga thermotolerans TaxID=2651334 RepID=A0A5P9K4X6_9HYPH|nr:IclR family transcriptional regulator [Microvirga thermotolerans]QFU17524.1 helix-turn-helix domain-containing protein [Microvirga thermotolerans]
MSAVERLLDVLVTVATASEPVSAKQVSERAGIPLSSAYRHLTLLKDRDFIVDLGRDLGYGPGPICLKMAQSFDRTSQVLAVALPEMQRLSLLTQESVGLMKALGTEVFCLEMIESPQSLRCSFSKGRSQPLSRGASAKALLAFLPQTVQDEVCNRLLGDDDAARSALLRDLKEVRARGYAESEGEVDAGVWGASAPIFSHDARLEGGLSLMAPSTRVGQRRDELIQLTVATAKVISMRLQQV